MKKHFNTFSLILGLSALLSGLSACIARDDIDFSEDNTAAISAQVPAETVNQPTSDINNMKFSKSYYHKIY